MRIAAVALLQLLWTVQDTNAFGGLPTKPSITKTKSIAKTTAITTPFGLYMAPDNRIGTEIDTKADIDVTASIISEQALEAGLGEHERLQDTSIFLDLVSASCGLGRESYKVVNVSLGTLKPFTRTM